MKVAVLVIGEYREFKIAVNSWNFKNYDYIDYWISTWDTSICDNIVEKVNEESFTEYLSNIKDIGIHSSEYISYQSEKIVDTPLSWRWHWMSVHEKLEETIKSQNLKYDYILIVRPDIWITNDDNFLSKSFLNNINDDTIYSLSMGEPSNEVVNDLLFYGKFNVMMDFISKSKHKPTEHFNLAQVIFNNFKSELNCKLDVSVVRPEARVIDKKNYNIKLFRILDENFTKQRELELNTNYE